MAYLILTNILSKPSYRQVNTLFQRSAQNQSGIFWKQSKEEKGKTYYRSERTYGFFSRVIDLPAEVNPNQADANLSDGILEVKLPKKKSTKAKRVEIKIK